jgi:recombination protein RecA
MASQARPSAQRTFSLPEKYMVAPPTKKGLHGGGFGAHPRNEVKGLSDAVSGLLKPEAFAPTAQSHSAGRGQKRRPSSRTHSGSR